MKKENQNIRPGMFHARGISSPVDRPKDFKKTIAKLIKYLSASNKIVVLSLLFASLSSVLSIFGPKILGKATTSIFESLMSGDAIDFSYIGQIIVFLTGLYAVSMLFMYLQGYLLSGVAQQVSYSMRKDIAKKIERLPMKYFDTKNHGEVLSIVTNDVDTVSSTLNQSLPQIAASVTTIVGVLAMMLSISVLMTVFTLITVPLSLVLIRTIAKRSQGYFKDRQNYLGELNGLVEEMYGANSVVKAFNGEQKALDDFTKSNEKLCVVSWKAQFISGLMMPITSFVSNFSYVAVAVIGGWLAVKRTVALGDIQAFIQYVRSFTMPLTQTAQIANILQATAAAAERVFNFLDEQEEPADLKEASSVEKVEGFVDFSHVNFGYNPNKTIIHDFSVRVAPGQHVAIVGPTGAGKSTLVKLMLRFYDINSGNISIDRTDITEIKRKDLRKQFGMVLQDTWLFNGTIMENIRYGRLDATDDEVIEAAKSAYADYFIRGLPGGYNMEINEEASNISQGQMQLLTIARAILASPHILVLDEATSSVDTRTEVYIQKAMKKMMRNKTSFIIAHRLSTIKDADLILVLKEGDIVEKGTHQELLALNGFYKSLYDSQFEDV